MNSQVPEIKSKFDMSSIKYPNKILADMFLKPAKIRYSTMTKFQRLCLARDACWIFTEEIYFDVFRFLKTNAWYDPYLKVLKDLGYDVSKLKINDWDQDLTEDFVSMHIDILDDIEKRLKRYNKRLECRCLQQVIFDD